MPQKDHTGQRLIVKLPAMVGTQSFTPSYVMIETLCAYLQVKDNNKVMSPIQILKANHRSINNWYKWQKKEGFAEWWLDRQVEYHKRIGLPAVHRALHRYALGNSPQDRKLYLERFDPDYKPTTGTEHTFPGLPPPEDLDVAVERSKARAVDSEVIEQEGKEGAV